MSQSDSYVTQGMHGEITWRLDPADLADRIRRMALDAHRTLKRHDVAPSELVELTRRIDELRQGTQETHFIEIDRWLRTARQLIESRRRSNAANQRASLSP